VKTTEELADILTKALGPQHFSELRSNIGVIDTQTMRKI